MGPLVHRRLAIPLWAMALFPIALTAPLGATLLLMPAGTVFVVAALGITAMTFRTSRAILPCGRLARSPASVHQDSGIGRVRGS
jgi:hypothetical protein